MNAKKILLAILLTLGMISAVSAEIKQVTMRVEGMT
jgi:hypothetical protein